MNKSFWRLIGCGIALIVGSAMGDSPKAFNDNLKLPHWQIPLKPMPSSDVSLGNEGIVIVDRAALFSEEKFPEGGEYAFELVRKETQPDRIYADHWMYLIRAQPEQTGAWNYGPKDAVALVVNCVKGTAELVVFQSGTTPVKSAQVVAFNTEVPSIPAEQWFKIRVRDDGETVKVYWEDKEVLSATNAELKGPEGQYVGFSNREPVGQGNLGKMRMGVRNFSYKPIVK